MIQDSSSFFNLERFNSEDNLELSIRLPDATSDANWAIEFDTMGYVYAIGTTSGPYTVGGDLAVFKAVQATDVLVSSVSFHGGVNGQAFSFDATGDVWIAGAVASGTVTSNGPTQSSLSLWRYCIHNNILKQTATYTRNGGDLGLGVRVLNGNIWIIGYSGEGSLASSSPYDLALWEYDSTGKNLIGGPFLRPNYLPNLNNLFGAKLETAGGALFAAVQKQGAQGETDLDFLKFDGNGAYLGDLNWTSPAGANAVPTGIGVDATGDIWVAGQVETSAATHLGIWKYGQTPTLLGSYVDAANDGANGLVLAGSAVWLASLGQGAPVPFKGTLSGGSPFTSVLISSGPTFTADILYASAKTVFELFATNAAQTLLAVDTMTFAPYGGPFSLSAEGLHTLSYYSVGSSGITESSRTATVGVDETPPQTTLQILGPSANDSSGNLIISSTVMLALSAADPVSNGVASGVSQTFYVVDADPTSPACQATPEDPAQPAGTCANESYAGPFTLPVGSHSIYYLSEDEVQNQEQVNVASITVLMTAVSDVAIAGQPQLTLQSTAQYSISEVSTVTSSGQTLVVQAATQDLSLLSPVFNVAPSGSPAPAQLSVLVPWQGALHFGNGLSTIVMAHYNGAGWDRAPIPTQTVQMAGSLAQVTAEIAAGGSYAVLERSLSTLPDGAYAGLALNSAPDGTFWQVWELGWPLNLSHYASSGALLSTTPLPGTADYGTWSVEFDSAGYVYAIGTAGPLFGGQSGIIVYRLSNQGVIISSVGYVSPPSLTNPKRPHQAIALDAAGDFWIAGYVNSPAFNSGAGSLALWRYCPHANALVLTTTYSRGNDDRGSGIRIVGGDIWISGLSADAPFPPDGSYPPFSLALWHYDPQGKNLLGGPFTVPLLSSSPNGPAPAVLETANNRLFVAATKSNGSGGTDADFLEFDTGGNLLAERELPSPPGDLVGPAAIRLDSAGDLDVAGIDILNNGNGPTALNAWTFTQNADLLGATANPVLGGANGMTLDGPNLWLALARSTSPYLLSSLTLAQSSASVGGQPEVVVQSTAAYSVAQISSASQQGSFLISTAAAQGLAPVGDIFLVSPAASANAPVEVSFVFDPAVVSTASLNIYHFDGVSWSSAVVVDQTIQPLPGGLDRITGYALNASPFGLFVYRPDRTPPVTTLFIGQPQVALSTGVLVSTSTPLALISTDPFVGGFASGVKSAFLSIDGGTFAAVASSFTISTAGWHTLAYYAVDNAGNAEVAKSSAVLVLAAPPAIALASPSPADQGVGRVIKGRIPVLGSVTDPYLSSWALAFAPGQNAVSTFTVISSGTVALGSAALGTWDATALSGWQTLRLTAVDLVQNAAALTVNVFVGDPGQLMSLGNDDIFNLPQGVAVGPGGNIYVADTNDQRIAVFSSTGTFLSSFGQSAHDGDDLRKSTSTMKLNQPRAVAVDGNGDIFIADSFDDRVLELSPTGQLLLTIAGGLNRPSGVAMDGAGHLYVADTLNSRVQVFSSTGAFLLGFSLPPLPASHENDHEKDDQAAAGKDLGRPYGIALDAAGRIYVADPPGGRALVYGTTGQLLLTLPIRGVDQAGKTVSGRPEGIAVSASGAEIIISDKRFGRILKFDSQGDPTLTFGQNFRLGVNPSPQAIYLRKPAGLALDASGDLFVADRNNDRIKEFSSPTGQPTLVVPPPGPDSSAAAVGVLDQDTGGSVQRKDSAGIVVPGGALPDDLKIVVATESAATSAQDDSKNSAIQAQGILPAYAPVEYRPEGAKFAKPVTLVLPYDPSLLASLGVSEQDLLVHYWNPATARWQAFDSKVDADRHTVTAQTTHFSLYQVMIGSAAVRSIRAQAASDTVGTIQTACNPLRPDCQPLKFRNVPAGARLRLYTLSGALVKDLTADGSGQTIWDGTNQGGQPAASGIYFVFAQGNGTTKTIKIAVER